MHARCSFPPFPSARLLFLPCPAEGTRDRCTAEKGGAWETGLGSLLNRNRREGDLRAAIHRGSIDVTGVVALMLPSPRMLFGLMSIGMAWVEYHPRIMPLYGLAP